MPAGGCRAASESVGEGERSLGHCQEQAKYLLSPYHLSATINLHCEQNCCVVWGSIAQWIKGGTQPTIMHSISSFPGPPLPLTLPHPGQSLGTLGIPGPGGGGRGGGGSRALPHASHPQNPTSLTVSEPGQGQGTTPLALTAPPPRPQEPPSPCYDILNRAESMALSRGWLGAGGAQRERRVTKAVPCFPSGLQGANECAEPQPGGSQSVFILLCLFSV